MRAHCGAAAAAFSASNQGCATALPAAAALCSAAAAYELQPVRPQVLLAADVPQAASSRQTTLRLQHQQCNVLPAEQRGAEEKHTRVTSTVIPQQNRRRRERKFSQPGLQQRYHKNVKTRAATDTAAAVALAQPPQQIAHPSRLFLSRRKEGLLIKGQQRAEAATTQQTSRCTTHQSPRNKKARGNSRSHACTCAAHAQQQQQHAG